MNRLVLAMALAGATMSAQAQVYKCKEGGRVVFSDVPCIQGSEQVKVAPAAGHWDAESAARVQQENSALQAKVRRLDAIRERRVYVGMTRDDVIESWGRPDSVNRDVYAGAVKEQWIYERSEGGRQYVYVDNGLVTAIQSR